MDKAAPGFEPAAACSFALTENADASRRGSGGARSEEEGGLGGETGGGGEGLQGGVAAAPWGHLRGGGGRQGDGLVPPPQMTPQGSCLSFPRPFSAPMWQFFLKPELPS